MSNNNNQTQYKELLLITSKVKQMLHKTNTKYKKNGKLRNIIYFLNQLKKYLFINDCVTYNNSFEFLIYSTNFFILTGKYENFYNEIYKLYKDFFNNKHKYEKTNTIAIIVYFQCLLKYIQNISK